MKKANNLRRPNQPNASVTQWSRSKLAAALCTTAAALAAVVQGGATGCVVTNPVDAPKFVFTGPPAPPGAANAAANAAPSPASLEPSGPSAFTLKPEWEGPCTRTDTVDVNLGNSPESFVKAAYCQIVGEPAPAKTVEQWAGKLRSDGHVRRIDIVRSLAAEGKHKIKLAYSDPWRSQPDLLGAPEHKNKRDIGAVFMFFFDCPGKTNCSMDWANTHAPGMDKPTPLLGTKPGEGGFYSPSEVGFWRRELLDAKYAGLQFLLLNTYGPDIADGKLAPLAKALASLDEPVKIAMFDDTWTWGQPYFSDFWKQKPDLKDAERAANTIYESKWKPFYSQVDKKYWYRFKGRPFIYFYNSGTLEPRNRSAPVVAKLKARFKADFGEEPFVDVDTAYFEDQDMPKVADARFLWMTFGMPDKKSRSKLNGSLIDHAMVRWDAVGRDRPGDMANDRDRLVKDGEVLKRVLIDSSDAELLVLATWNDLGEGTGINRNYDYYANGHWLPPDYFMQILRKAQSAGGK